MARGKAGSRRRTKLISSRHLLLESLQSLSRTKYRWLTIVALHAGLVLLLAPNATSDLSRTWGFLLLLVFSLAEIWMVRQFSAGKAAPVKTALYSGTAPFVPFTLVAFLLSIQLIPFAAGLWLYQVVVVGGIAVSGLEQVMFTLIWLLLALLSFYWIIAGVFVLYVVSLPGVAPMQAWHTAVRLVEGRRGLVGLRLLVLLLSVAAVAYVIILPVPDEWLARYNVIGLAMALLLPLAHIYCYKLYRALT